MTLLGVAILMARRRVGDLAGQAIMPQQGLIALRERLALFARRDGRRQPVGAVRLRYAAQFPEGVLQAVAEALQALAETQGPGLPVRVGQDEMENQVRERHTSDGHAQAGGVGEVGGTQTAGCVDLGEEHLFGRAVQGASFLETTLQGPQLALGEASGIATLQVGEQGLSLQSGVEPQHLVELRPDIGERVGARAVVAVHDSHLAGQLAEPPVLACGLGIDTGLGGGLFFGPVLRVEVAQAAHLSIADHPKPPCEEGLRIS